MARPTSSGLAHGPAAPAEARVRVDVWLWRARLFKSRSLAADAVSAGAVRLARAGASRSVAKPSELVGPGDGLSVRTARGVITLTLVAVGERRGPPAEARGLYDRLAAEGLPSGSITEATDASDDPHA